MADRLPRPPGHTCPRLDAILRHARRLAWRAQHGRSHDVRAVLRELVLEVEALREDNRQLRTAYYAARAAVESR